LAVAVMAVEFQDFKTILIYKTELLIQAVVVVVKVITVTLLQFKVAAMAVRA
jgi:uncharacterized integral membrane protein